MNKEGENPTCPFCSFTVESANEHDIYFLMQHLELCHPENGETPFIATNHDRNSRGGRGELGHGESYLSTSMGMESTPSLAAPSSDDEYEDDAYIDCPAKCGETVLVADLSSHMELHGAEGFHMEAVGSTPTKNEWQSEYRDVDKPEDRAVAIYRESSGSGNEPPISPSYQSRSSTTGSTRERRPRSSPRKSSRKDEISFKDLKDRFLGRSPKKTSHSSGRSRTKRHSGVRRLGKSELGPHAFEERMPTWLYKQLETGAKITHQNQIAHDGRIVRVERVANETPSILPVLAQLCASDSAIDKVFLCHPSVKHIVKMAREGGFCGYRNIQMLVSYIQETKAQGWEHFKGRTPGILKLQDMIEAAWAHGVNASGKIETGGIKGTRKYIGTPEAQALFNHLGIGCDACAFTSPEKPEVYRDVLASVLEYFMAGVTEEVHEKVYRTALPPIYFQHPGHSLTIVGLEVRKSGSMNLLVFDPMFKTSPLVQKLVGTRFRALLPEMALRAYRRGEGYLGKYKSFEILKLKYPPAQAQQSWPHSR